MSFEHLYLTNRATIEQTISVVCRRQRLSSTDTEDFAGAVRLHLVQNDYAVLRKFENRSSFRTYLITVITHFYRDWRNARWGKWRSSAEAKRQGPVAVHLERLVVRDGLTFDEAYETLRTNFLVPESKDALESMLRRFPARQTRQFVSDSGLEEHAAATRSDDLVRERDIREAARAAGQALESALASLTYQDRLILRMRFQDGFTIVAIARALHLDAKPLYRRIDRLLASLRAGLAKVGLTAQTASQVLADGGFGLMPEDQADEVEFRRGVRHFRKGHGSQFQSTRTP